MSDAFLLVDPTVSRERLCSLVANGFQILHAFFRARFFVSASTWCGTNDGEDDYAKERKKKHDANPRGQRGARVRNLAKRFRFRHFQFVNFRDSINRGSRMGKSEVLGTTCK